ncbi:MotA/TolQ/ExbB proton channel family protein [Oceaniserpentilla sp. 4NH20-0058]|uniref:MotA/TolQ/ExbB proton channel family protein n=1 Tax=Oceaniserpentilla sp. 4NH20-0058 TaxID=3127660 RepID=UPI00310A8AB6
MKELVFAGGWMMIPLILSSILAVAICIERFFTLRTEKIAPKHLLAQVWMWIKNNELDGTKLKQLKQESHLGSILAAGLSNSRHGRDITKEAIEQAASKAIHEMERFLNALGTIAAVAPLMGLLGTVLGMISVFNEILAQGTGNAGVLAGGISEALVTTAAGMMIAIPALICFRVLQRRIDEIVVFMEQEAVKLVDVLHGDREVSEMPEG